MITNKINAIRCFDGGLLFHDNVVEIEDFI